MPNKSRALLAGDLVAQQDKNTGEQYLISGTRMIPAGSQIAGQVTGTAAGSYVRGPNVYSPDGFMIGGHPSNTSYVSIGLTGTPGFTLNPGVSQYLPVENLNDWYLSVAVSGEKIVWLMV